MSKVSILGVARKDPFDYRTSSGSSSHLFKALQNQNTLYTAISSRPSRLVERLQQALNIQTDIRKWKFKNDISVAVRDHRTKIALKKMASFNEKKFNVILQIGAWCDLTKQKNKLTTTYQDGNLQTLLNSPYPYLNIHKRHINKALEYEKRLYRRMDCVFPRSLWLADSFIKDFGIDPNRVSEPIGAGINLPYVKDTSGKSYNEPHILFVGREFERKGGHVLVKAFCKVRQSIRDAQLTIVGSILNNPPEGVKCIDRISKNSSEGIEKLVNEYSSASVFVMPSLYEPWGIVFAEAMAHRLPCVGTRDFAIQEIIDDGKTGMLVEPGDSDKLAKSLISLLSDPDKCREMGECGYAKYMSHYRWEVVAEKLIRHLKRII